MIEPFPPNSSDVGRSLSALHATNHQSTYSIQQHGEHLAMLRVARLNGVRGGSTLRAAAEILLVRFQ